MTKRTQEQTMSLVNQVGFLKLRGNVTPRTWYKHLTHKNGKPNLVAITILADVLYWYRPTMIEDAVTGQVTGYKRKFKGDMLQRSYRQLCEMFGFGKAQVRNAVNFLKDKGLLYTDFRTIYVGGMKLTNVLYMEPVVVNIKKISMPEPEITTSEQVLTSMSIPSSPGSEHPLHLDVDTNTGITTGITTKDPPQETEKKESYSFGQLLADTGKTPPEPLPESKIRDLPEKERTWLGLSAFTEKEQEGKTKYLYEKCIKAYGDMVGRPFSTLSETICKQWDCCFTEIKNVLNTTAALMEAAIKKMHSDDELSWWWKKGGWASGPYDKKNFWGHLAVYLAMPDIQPDKPTVITGGAWG